MAASRADPRRSRQRPVGLGTVAGSRCSPGGDAVVTITVIINPVSGRRGHRDGARRKAALAIARLTARGADVRVAITEGPGHAHVLAREAVSAGAGLVAAWGGDGTMNEVASALAGTSVVLGLVPGGSGNGLARDLGIPLRAEQALEVLVDGRDRDLDGGILDGHLFFNVAGLGLDARVARAFQASGGRGILSYVVKTARALLDGRGTACVIEADGRSVAADALLVALANSRQYGSGLLIAPSARVDDGVIDVVVVPRMPLVRLLRYLPRVLAGAIDAVPGVSVVKVAHATIQGTSPLAYHVDGEPHEGGMRLSLSVRPHAVRVRVPA